MRVFGHFEHPIFLELVKQIEYLTVSTNQHLFKVQYSTVQYSIVQHLFKVGDPDENIFIVQSGLVNVYASDPAEVTSNFSYDNKLILQISNVRAVPPARPP